MLEFGTVTTDEDICRDVNQSDPGSSATDNSNNEHTHTEDHEEHFATYVTDDDDDFFSLIVNLVREKHQTTALCTKKSFYNDVSIFMCKTMSCIESIINIKDAWRFVFVRPTRCNSSVKK